MTLSDDVNVEEYIMSKDDLSGADIKAICTEAGLMALRYLLKKFKSSYLLMFYDLCFYLFPGNAG